MLHTINISDKDAGLLISGLLCRVNHGHTTGEDHAELLQELKTLRRNTVVTMDELGFTSMGRFREHFFPNMAKEERKPKRMIVILPRPGV